jgi:deazaflavin-dependent oxidoreductase (nitroreductase family)
MGIVDDLGYRSPPPNWFQRGVGSAAGNRVVSTLLARTMADIDRLALKTTGGRSTLSGWLAGQPVIWLTVRGRRSGRPHRVPLSGIPFDDDLAVIGSYFGSTSHPAWALNLEANPEVKVSFRDRTVEAIGRRAGAHEEADIWLAATVLYPGYHRYRERVDRPIKVFVLESPDTAHEI